MKIYFIEGGVMKNCETCGVPQEKRPGVCLEFMAKYTDGPYNCWKPEEPEKTCGNCGWHGMHYKGNTWAVCNNSKDPYESIHDGHGFRTEDTRKAGELRSCQWKPICETCGGTGEICDKCGMPWEKCKNNAHIGVPELIPCPTCKKPKKENKRPLMLEAKWIESPDSDRTSSIKDLVINDYRIADIRTRNGKYAISITNHYIPGQYDTPEHAQKAVEKALGIERG